MSRPAAAKLFAVISLASFALLGGGLVFSHWLHLAACPLCIWQRMLYLLLGVAALIGWASGTARLAGSLMGTLCALIAATGAGVAAYQVWIQRFAPEVNCSANAPWWERFVDWAGTQAPFLFEASGLCSDPAWKFLNLSIAEWSLLAFAALFVLALLAALPRSPK